MTTPIAASVRPDLEALKAALERNQFAVRLAADAAQAGRLALTELLPAWAPATVSWGDSMTMAATGVLDELRANPAHELIVTFDPAIPRPQLLENRRRALLADLFLTGSNAVTAQGHLVNLDMVGNRIAGLAYGPRRALVFVGRNKIVPDLAAAMERVRAVAAPANARRHGFQTPCAVTGRCQDCVSPQRLCNSWLITQRSHPPGRITVVLIDQDLGL